MKAKTGLKPGKILGNLMEKTFKVTGIADRADKYERVTGKSCGCEKRHQIVDKLCPI